MRRPAGAPERGFVAACPIAPVGPTGKCAVIRVGVRVTDLKQPYAYVRVRVTQGD